MIHQLQSTRPWNSLQISRFSRTCSSSQRSSLHFQRWWNQSPVNAHSLSRRGGGGMWEFSSQRTWNNIDFQTSLNARGAGSSDMDQERSRQVKSMYLEDDSL